MTTISFLTASDLDAALCIEQRSHAFPWTRKIMAGNLGEHYLNYRLDVDGNMAGFAITQTVLDEATLLNIAIDPAYRRQGLARALLNHLTAQLRQRNVVTLWLEVRVSNTAATGLYQQLGFNEVSLRRNYYPAASGREDALVMALIL